MNRTLVISIDALITADIPRLRDLPNLGRVMKNASWARDILCVYPTLTYPCHASIATGCYPDRHGILTNTYVPQVRPIAGLADHLSRCEKRCAMFYTWEPLRDLTRPGHLCRSVFASEKDICTTCLSSGQVLMRR